MTATATFAKLNDGSWGLRAPLHSLNPGQSVQVRTRAGATKTVRVGGKVMDDRGAWNQNGPKGASYYRIASAGR